MNPKPSHRVRACPHGPRCDCRPPSIRSREPYVFVEPRWWDSLAAVALIVIDAVVWGAVALLVLRVLV